MKKTLITLCTLALTVLVGSQITNAIGTLTPSGDAGDNTQYTLNDIYAKITAGTSGTIGDDALMTVPGSVSASFRTLTEIYNAIPATLSLVASTTTVPVGINRATTTLTAIDADLVAANIASGQVIFGITGTAEGTPPLEWSTDKGTQANFSAAEAMCAALTDGSHTDWRLPEPSELLANMGCFFNELSCTAGTAQTFVSDENYFSSVTWGEGSDDWMVTYSDNTSVFMTNTNGTGGRAFCVR